MNSILPAILVLIGVAIGGTAQSFSIDWQSIDTGGGTSTGAMFSVSGSIGQPDAGAPMTGGTFSLHGGFWSVTILKSVDAPPLKVFLTASNTAVLSWPALASEFVLQQSSNLSLSNWIAAPQLPGDNGTNRFIIVTPQPGNRFYRLFRP
jgi:hypothetical protein